MRGERDAIRVAFARVSVVRIALSMLSRFQPCSPVSNHVNIFSTAKRVSSSPVPLLPATCTPRRGWTSLSDDGEALYVSGLGLLHGDSSTCGSSFRSVAAAAFRPVAVWQWSPTAAPPGKLRPRVQ